MSDEKWTPPQGMDRARALTIALQEVKSEALRTSNQQPVFNSVHEGYAVLLEELDELWVEIKRKEVDLAKVRTEGIHVGVMVARLVSELTPPKETP